MEQQEKLGSLLEELEREKCLTDSEVYSRLGKLSERVPSDNVCPELHYELLAFALQEPVDGVYANRGCLFHRDSLRECLMGRR